MRTRFLNRDYFTTTSSSSSSSSSSPIETLSFLNLPVPHFAPSRLSTSDDDLLRFDSVLNISLEIETLPIDSALSKFFAQVIPQNVAVAKCCGDDQRRFRFSEKEDEVLFEEKEMESRRTFGSESLEKDNETTGDDKYTHKSEVIQFETPELDIFLENACSFKKEHMQILSEVQEIENNPDMLMPGLTLQYPVTVQESVYSVEDVTSEYYAEQKAYMLEDDGSFQDQTQFHHTTFPLLEVDEISLGILISLSMEDIFLSLLENNEPRTWTQKDNLLMNGKELLGSVKYDIFEFLSGHCLSKQCLISEPAFQDIFPEVDFISMGDSQTIHQGTSDGDCFFSTNLVTFQEFQFLDVDASQLFEDFFGKQTADEPEACDWMFREDMNFKNFNELIVSQELALVDGTFKSLPIPVLSDHEKMKSLYLIVEEILAELKPQPLSSSDGIYLDWHVLEEDKCNYKFYSSYQSMLEEIESHNIDFDQESFHDGKLVFDFAFSDDALNRSNEEKNEESLNILSDGISMLNGHLMRVASTKLLNGGCPKPGNGEQIDASDGISMLNDHLMGVASTKLLDGGCPKPGNEEQIAENNAEKASLLFKSMSQFNDLDFFLNPRQATAKDNTESAVKAFDTNSTFSKVSSHESMAACASAGLKLKQWDIRLYQVKLSDNIIALIENLEKRYITILQNETELTKTHCSVSAEDNYELLSLPKQKLMDCIKKIRLQRTTRNGGENIMAFVTLCAIKQMAWYMCFYGFHTTHLYVDKLCRSLPSLKSRLGFLHSLIEDAHVKVDKEITRSHPSLSVIQGIIRSNTTYSSLKVLVVAEQVFWWSVKSLLMSMGLSCTVCDTKEFANTEMDALLGSDCLLVSHEHVYPSFPFNKFSMILEYGGSYDSSRICSLSTKLVGLPRLHFLKVKLDDHSASKALCEGVDMVQNIAMMVEGESDSILAPDENMKNKKLEELLNFIPVVDNCTIRPPEAADEVEACCMPLSVPCAPYAVESEQVQQGMVTFPDTVIIVNTQNFDKEMLVSRRSTYQRILAMEKEGAQVVERDSELPVDVIISSEICLVWYDCRNIGKKSTASDEASSSLPLCVENIATNILTLLSFTFSGCILVFEGEISFLSTVMESSDELYAAAASLGIDLQLFCSYSSELTDEIILSCIGYASMLTRGLYPKMPESETLAESFLTKFPSVNPLTAHAIMSSGGMLIEYLAWSHERRIQAIKKYYVPDESVNLFSALCRYGEREDSKSIMTDCSSSVSSGLDSDKCHFNVDSPRKRRRYIGSPQKIDMHMDDLFHFEPLNQFTDGILNTFTVSKPNDSWMSKDPEIFDVFKKPSASFKDLFGQKQELDIGITMNPSGVSKPYNSRISKAPQMLDEIKKPSLPINDKLLGRNHGSEMAMMNNLDWHNINNCENLHEEFRGEVIDLTASSSDFSSIANPVYFPPLVPEMEKDSVRKSKTVRRLSFSKNSHPTFPTAAEINSASDIQNSVKDQRQSVQGTNDYPDADYDNEKLPSKDRKRLLEEILTQGSARKSQGLPFQEEISHYSGTPLSSAIHAAHPQPGSPWTIEFLNRIREKSRMRQQSLPCDKSAPCFGHSGNISNVTKRKSPSILEFFKYKGGSTPRKVPEQKRLKRSMQSSGSSMNEKTSASLPSTWTPLDKRARQTLSFAMNESESQTKLVWNNGSGHGLSKKFRNQ